MSHTQQGTQTIEAEPEDPFGASMGFAATLEQPVANRSGSLPTAMPMGGALGARSDAAMAQIITAQRVAVKRNIPEIRREARDIAMVMGDDAFYFWETKNRDGTRGQVMGPSIDCAMAAISAYGNCSIEAFPAVETDSHWIFLARFVDYEKGVTVTRSFQQRKAQNLGMKKDADRQLDIVFQIGQSKASRNAVVAGLKWLTTEMVSAARSVLVERIKAKPEEAREHLLKMIRSLDIPLEAVERHATRPAARWTVPDMAGLYGKITSIKDGMVTWQDVFSDAPTVDAETGEVQQGAETQPRGAPQAQPVGETPKSPAARAPRQAKQKEEEKPAAAEQQPKDAPLPPGDDDPGEGSGELSFG